MGEDQHCYGGLSHLRFLSESQKYPILPPISFPGTTVRSQLTWEVCFLHYRAKAGERQRMGPRATRQATPFPVALGQHLSKTDCEGQSLWRLRWTHQVWSHVVLQHSLDGHRNWYQKGDSANKKNTLNRWHWLCAQLVSSRETGQRLEWQSILYIRKSLVELSLQGTWKAAHVSSEFTTLAEKFRRQNVSYMFWLQLAAFNKVPQRRKELGEGLVGIQKRMKENRGHKFRNLWLLNPKQ